jgi:predicted ABC-type ATPase
VAGNGPSLYVLAGANGAGKSSIAGAMVRRAGADYFNPDEAARRIRAANPHISQEDANSAAWHQGTRLLRRAIAERLDFAFETTLGGRTITGLLEGAAADGAHVHVWYTGLATPEMHVARVRGRVARGGHDIPEETIGRRYDASRLNLIGLLPHLAELRLYDNSKEANPHQGHAPEPALLLHCSHGTIVYVRKLRDIPGWAKPIVAAALRGGGIIRALED